MRKFIIDTDPGIDDAFALITAFSLKDVKVMGITTVAGNKGIDTTTGNALKLVTLMDYDCFVYQGAKESLHIVSSDAGDTHGSDGLGGVNLDFDSSKLSSKSAVDFIIETVRDNPGEIEIITIGPVTNIANAIQKEPQEMRNIKAIYSMGGGINKGNVTPTSEFNYWYDCKAAHILFEHSKFVPIHMIGLDLTHQSVVPPNFLNLLRLLGSKTGEILFTMTIPYLKTYYEFNSYNGCVLHDLTALLYAYDQSICSDILQTYIDISLEPSNLGQTVPRKKEGYHVFVPRKLHEKKYLDLFLKTVFGEEMHKKFTEMYK